MNNLTRAAALLSILFFNISGCASDQGNTPESATPPQTVPDSAGPKETPLPLTVLNANLAGEEEMKILPHMTAELAHGIVEKRPFLSISVLNQFLEASLNEDQRNELYVQLFVPIDLNNATREEIMMVPGIGKKMAHEFEEYRPYTKPAQFRREMGKYVDEAEVQRMEKYVFVPVNLNTADDEHILSLPGVGEKMLHEFKEYRPYKNIEQFNREIGKYVDEKELSRLRSMVYVEQK